ncbi:uncharacterized protein JCM15063_002185 [Sporobolomyces koalae]|uniref:uncharacterized protein n=1 Tax=Sporobolomyces koalae TaxID=500713 RepID=UPI0031769212
MHLYPRYLEVTTSSTSSTSRLAHVGHDDAPSSAFSDWGTSGAGTPSRTTSSQSLLSVELRDDAVSEISESGQEGANDSQQTPVGGFGRSENVVDKEQSKSESTTSDPYTSPACIVHDPALLKLELHHHHHSHSHHRHARHALLPKPTIADSSYPELAVAFFSSLTRSKARKLERRASTGSLGGAV